MILIDAQLSIHRMRAMPAPIAPTTPSIDVFTPIGSDIARTAPPELVAGLAAAELCPLDALGAEAEANLALDDPAELEGVADDPPPEEEPVELPTRPTPYALVEAPSRAQVRPPITWLINVSFRHAAGEPTFSIKPDAYSHWNGREMYRKSGRLSVRPG
jgi:hypothetical protein